MQAWCRYGSSALARGQVPIYEPGLTDLVAAEKLSIRQVF
jgi:hypothetical protein